MSNLPITSSMMFEMLKNHYGGSPSKPEPGYFLGELVAPYGERRIDGLWVPLSSQLRGQLHGIEIKVSRADLMVELADPRKADSWLQHCDRWWLAVSNPAFLEGLEIPEHWGILTPPDGKRSKRLMTVVRVAPKLKPTNQAAALGVVMARLFYGGGDADATIRWLRKNAQNDSDRVASAEHRMHQAEDALRLAQVLPGEAEQIQAVLRRVQALSFRNGGQSTYGWMRGHDKDVDTIARAILDAAVLRRETLDLASQLDRARKDLNAAAESLAADTRSQSRAIKDALERIRKELEPA